MELKIRKAIIDMNYRPFLGDKGVDRFIESGAAHKYLQDNIVDCWLIENEDKMLGFCVCKGDLLDLMMVETAFHGKGYGSKLLKHVETIMFSDFEEIKLESFERNEEANNFYSNHGWVQSEKRFDKASNVFKLIF